MYIAFRFEWIYGVAAVIAVFHDTLVTLGLFSIFNKEISLTVIAALLTLVGYSMNDTIVIFDRVRENLKTDAPRVSRIADEPEHEPDAGPDDPDFGVDFPDGDRAVPFRGTSIARLFFCAGCRYYCRDVFDDFYCKSDRVVLAELYGRRKRSIASAPASPVKPPARKSPTRAAK